MKIIRNSESDINHVKYYEVSFMKIYMTRSNTG